MLDNASPSWKDIQENPVQEIHPHEEEDREQYDYGDYQHQREKLDLIEYEH